MRTCSTRRSLLFPLVTKHFVTFFAITYLTSVTRLNEVECASLLPQRPHQQDDITSTTLYVKLFYMKGTKVYPA